MPGDISLLEEELARMLINPCYAITLDAGLIEEHEPLVSKDEWIGANMNLLKELGPEKYLSTLLRVLEGDCPRNLDDDAVEQV